MRATPFPTFGPPGGQTPDELRAQAERRFEEGDYVEAVRLANRAVTLRPGDARLYRVRRRLIRAFKNACRTPAGLAKVVRADPNLVWFYNERFEAHCCFNRFEDVLRQLDGELRRQPRNARALALRGELLRMPNFSRYAEALESLRRAAAADPRSAWIAAFHGRALVHAGRSADGLKELGRAAKLDPGCGWIRAWLGEARYNLGEPARALPHLDEAVRLDPECPAAYAWRGAAKERLGRAAAALADLERALDLHRRYAEVYVWPSRSFTDWDELIRIDLFGLSLERGFTLAARARALARLGRLDDAVEAMTTAHDLDSKYSWVEGESSAADWKRLDALMTRAIRENGRRAATFSWRGLARARLGRAAEALSDYSRALALDPKSVHARAWRAELRLASGDAAGALADAGRALKLDPRRAAAHAVRAQAHQRGGRLRAASKALSTLLRHEPKAAWALCWKGELDLKLGRPAVAARSLDKAVELLPTYPDALFWRAEARRALGRTRPALADIERAIELRPRHALSYVTRGLLRGAAGDPKGLVADFAAARRLEPALIPAA